MSKKKILFLILFITCLFFIAGCSEEKECDTSSDCPTKTCQTVRCSEGECEYNTLPNCCGNLKCDAAAGENECTCPKDCGECEGTETFKDASTGKERETEHLRYDCNEYDDCLLDSSRSQKQLFPKPKILTYFTLSITLDFEEPFDVLKSDFRVKFDLESVDEYLVFPVKLTGIKVLDKQRNLLGEKDITQQLDEVEDSFEEDMDLLKGTDVLEEEKYVILRVNYEYSIRESTGERDEEGNKIYAPSDYQPKSFEYQLSEKITFVNPRGAIG